MPGFVGRLIEGVVAIVAVATLPIGLLALIFLGWQWALVVFVVGWLLLVPIFGILTDVFGQEATERGRTRSENESQRSGSTTGRARSSEEQLDQGMPDPLTALRDRYARGEIDEEAFERRVDALLETDPNEPASRVASRTRERETERS